MPHSWPKVLTPEGPTGEAGGTPLARSLGAGEHGLLHMLKFKKWRLGAPAGRYALPFRAEGVISPADMS